MSKDVTIAFRIPSDLREKIKALIDQGLYMNESEFVREAIRQRLIEIIKEVSKDERGC